MDMADTQDTKIIYSIEDFVVNPKENAPELYIMRDGEIAMKIGKIQENLIKNLKQITIIKDGVTGNWSVTDPPPPSIQPLSSGGTSKKEYVLTGRSVIWPDSDDLLQQYKRKSRKLWKNKKKYFVRVKKGLVYDFLEIIVK